ncbi:MAG: rod shape-determining protein MreC [Candidatus Pacebacteria bacterium]|nr:rod shape-determining protein MreC [Candidatus Paceibacterota bacterium]|tara:strand:+ start:44534 stop:45343 length:810 start_codon:yes stop_codon:yes gene_type:complete
MNNYPLHHSKDGRGLSTKTFTTILLIIGILAAVHIFFPNALSGASHFISAPLWSAKNVAVESTLNSVQLLRSKKALVTENKNLKGRIKEIKFKLLSTELLKQENNSLNELFNRQIFDIEDTVLGTVLARPAVSFYDTFVIDIGKNADIRGGENVLVFEDIFIGTVDKVHRTTSTVKLFSSPGEVSQVSIGPENIAASAEGIGGGNFIIKLPRGAEIQKGDIVTMPKISTKIFAVVEEIESDPSDPFLTVLFKNPVNMNEVKWVQVVIND